MIGVDDWLLSKFPEWVWWLWLPRPAVLAESKFEHGLVKSCLKNTSLHPKKSKQTDFHFKENSSALLCYFMCCVCMCFVLFLLFLYGKIYINTLVDIYICLNPIYFYIKVEVLSKIWTLTLTPVSYKPINLIHYFYYLIYSLMQTNFSYNLVPTTHPLTKNLNPWWDLS